jgi:hypothetical protein
MEPRVKAIREPSIFIGGEPSVVLEHRGNKVRHGKCTPVDDPWDEKTGVSADDVWENFVVCDDPEDGFGVLRSALRKSGNRGPCLPMWGTALDHCCDA